MSDVIIGPTRAYRGLPEPPTRNLNELPPVVNNLLPYWIQHGRIDVAGGIERLDGRRVHFVDDTSREFDTILWATGFKVTLPFLDRSLIRERDGVPLRTAGLTLLVVRMLRLDPARRSALASHFAEVDVPDSRIDIVRAIWNRQLRDAHKALDRAALPARVARSAAASRGASP